jgi:predicted ATP-grasp superfamily ATP-dependent carboligase
MVAAEGSQATEHVSQIDVRQPILVLALADLSVHHGALGILRSAGRLGVSVFLAHGGAPTPLERSRYCAGHVRLAPNGSAQDTLGVLCKFHEEYGRAVLIPVDDSGAMFVEDHAAELAERFDFPRQPPGLVRSLASKRQMHSLCLEHGIPTPAAAFPESEQDVRDHARTAVFPVVAKRIDASLPCADSAPSVAIAHTPDELLRAYSLMESPLSANVLLQEYIPGTPESIWMFNGYFDMHSDCIVGFTGQKIRQSPPDTGATTLGACGLNPAVDATTRRLMKAVGYRGILDIGYRWDPRDGQYKLLDVNPRIGATFRLFVGADGIDVLRTQYLDLTGQPLPATSLKQGRRWLVEPLDLRSSLTYLRRGDVTLREWVRSFHRVEELAWWARDDPLPFLAALVLLARGYMRKRLQRR